MDITRRLRGLAPRLLRQLSRKPKRTQPIWEGEYPSFAAVPSSGPGFDGGTWVEKIIVTTEQTRERIRDGRNVHELVKGEYSVLPLVVAAIAGRDAALDVVDFGGGLGKDYLLLRAAIPSLRVRYHVVEVAALCDKGRELHRLDSSIEFHAAIPELERRPDLVSLHGALQFVADWRGVLRKLVAYKAPHVLFVHLPAGGFSTFASMQKNVEGSFIPCWFFSMAEIVDEMRAGGYELAYRAAMERSYDMHNFPTGKRLDHPCNLLFTRSAP